MSCIRSSGGFAVPRPLPLGGVSTSFPATENPISQGGIWTNGKADGTSWNNVRTTPGLAFASSLENLSGSLYDDNLAHIKSSYWAAPANQFAQGTVFRAGGYSPASGDDHEVELLLRFDITSGNARGYEVYAGLTNGGYLNITLWLGGLGSFAVLASTPITPLSNGDVLRAEIVGTVITAKINGTTALTWDTSGDATKWAGGQPGVGFYALSGAVLANYGWSAWSAGSM